MKTPSARAQRRLAARAGADDAERRQLLSQATDAMRHGALGDAEQAARRVLARMPDDAEALNVVGMVALGRGRGPEAAEILAKAARRAPRSAMIRCNHAFALRASGRLDEAAREAGEAARLDPRLVPAHAVLGTALVDLGRPEAALAPLTRALELAPGLGRVHFALGQAYRALGRDEEASRHFEAALTADPSRDEIWTLLGWLHVDARRYDEAVRWFHDGLVDKRASRWWPVAGGAPVRAAAPVPVTVAKLAHDVEQLGYLLDRGLVPADVAGVRDASRTLAGSLEKTHGVDAVASLSPAELGPLADCYARVVHWRETPAQDGPVLGDFDRVAVEARYAVPPGVCWVDGLLSLNALEALRRFCLDSTIWNDVSHNYRQGGTRRSYLGTYAHDGFCCPLLFQVAEELTRALPSIFKDHRLRQMWAYKYETDLEGIDIHGDNAAVNVNFWLTPDEANLNPDSGGLVVWPIEAPAEWDFDDYNKDGARIRGFLDSSGVAPVNVPYRQNRAVIFNSDLFHATAPLKFKPGYENRRINVTMLFGRREAQR